MTCLALICKNDLIIENRATFLGKLWAFKQLPNIRGVTTKISQVRPDQARFPGWLVSVVAVCPPKCVKLNGIDFLYLYVEILGLWDIVPYTFFGGGIHPWFYLANKRYLPLEHITVLLINQRSSNKNFYSCTIMYMPGYDASCAYLQNYLIIKHRATFLRKLWPFLKTSAKYPRGCDQNQPRQARFPGWLISVAAVCPPKCMSIYGYLDVKLKWIDSL
jgi:hypothetical protein